MNWYSSQCNGEWEHSWGLSIGTLDNPGWRVEINLMDTQWQDTQFEDLFYHESDNNWIRCKKKKPFLKDAEILKNLMPY